ncbi:MAG: type II secretion system F family protein [Phycisphaerales bacterium]|nr:type II secretion system F family protein [Phycisphaerales bacterium]
MSHLAFEYRAVDRTGGATNGTLQASSSQDAYRKLLAQGLTPIKIRSARSSRGKGRRGKIRPVDISHFTHQLSVLLEARIPISDCFRSIAEQEPNAKLREIALDLAQSVQSGKNITSALEPHRAIFGTVYVETIHAAETSGNMITVLGHLADAVEEEAEMRRTVRGALMYPIAVVAALTIATLFLVTFVVPKFAKMFSDRGVDLPFLTQVLSGLGVSIRHWWFVYLAVIIAAIFTLRTAWRNQASRMRIDAWMHKAPYLNAILTGVAVSRFASVLGISLRSGIGLIDALGMAGRASGRPLLMADTQRMVDQVRAGGRLREVVSECDYLPGFVKQLISAGEESGEIPRLCGVIAQHFSRETKHLTKNLATVIEPILIAGLTGVVLMIALAVFLPMWDMVKIVG